MNIAHNRDYSEMPAAPFEALSNWIFFRPVLCGHALVNDCSHRRYRCICIRKGPPFQQGNPHHMKVIAAHECVVGPVELIGRMIINYEPICRSSASGTCVVRPTADTPGRDASRASIVRSTDCRRFGEA